MNWAAFSLVRAELILLTAALESGVKYGYFHLLSESDFPVGSNKYIDNFFSNKDLEYLNVESINNKQAVSRIKYYYCLQERVGKKHGFVWLVQKMVILMQKIVGVNRLRRLPYKSIVKGSQWFSITAECANLVYSHRQDMFEYFSSGRATDELFMQTIVWNSKLRSKISSAGIGNVRYIRWRTKNSPEILTYKNDYNHLINGKFIFGRKFDPKTDNHIIDELERYRRKE